MRYWNALRYFAIIFTAASVATAMAIRNVYLAILGFVIGESLAIYAQHLARKNGEILGDEMSVQISGRSAMTAYVVSIVLFSWVGVILVILNDQISYWAETAGFTMLLFTLMMVAIYFISYFVMTRKATANEK
ncbi:MAG: DUF2178 domain-containing protein [Candidatus Methanomethylophilaceae archaeon]